MLEAGGDPAYAIPGDIGEVAFYPNKPGPFNSTQITTMSYARLAQSYQRYDTMYSAFNQ